MALDDWKLGDFFYLPLRKYAQKGILVSGASGFWKTVAEMPFSATRLEQSVLRVGYSSISKPILAPKTL